MPRLNTRIETIINKIETFELTEDNIGALMHGAFIFFNDSQVRVYDQRSEWAEYQGGPFQSLRINRLEAHMVKRDYKFHGLSRNDLVLEVSFLSEFTQDHNVAIILGAAPKFGFSEHGLYISQGVSFRHPYANRKKVFFSKKEV